MKQKLITDLMRSLSPDSIGIVQDCIKDIMSKCSVVENVNFVSGISTNQNLVAGVAATVSSDLMSRNLSASANGQILGSIVSPGFSVTDSGYLINKNICAPSPDPILGSVTSPKVVALGVASNGLNAGNNYLNIASDAFRLDPIGNTIYANAVIASNNVLNPNSNLATGQIGNNHIQSLDNLLIHADKNTNSTYEEFSAVKSKMESLEAEVTEIKAGIENIYVSEDSEFLLKRSKSFNSGLNDDLKAGYKVLIQPNNPRTIELSAESFRRLLENLPEILSPGFIPSHTDKWKRKKELLENYLGVSKNSARLILDQKYLFGIFSEIAHRKQNAKNYSDNKMDYKNLIKKFEVFLYDILTFKT